MFPSSSPSKAMYRGVLRSKIDIWDPKGCFCVTPGFEPATRGSRVRRPALWTSLPLSERGFRPSPGTMSRAGRPPGALAPSPFVVWCPAPGSPAALPFVVVRSGPLAGPGAAAPSSCPPATCTSRPGLVFRVPAPLGAFHCS